jgi:hypothetical protein
MDGPANPHDILKVLGEKAGQVPGGRDPGGLPAPGRAINDKHIEAIVRQMLRACRITDPGDTNFLVDEHVEKHIFEEENERVIVAGGKPPRAEPLLLGITKASLSTESFISASSFQETTKVLTEASINGEGRLPARPQGERHHGSPDPGRHRPGRVLRRLPVLGRRDRGQLSGRLPVTWGYGATGWRVSSIRSPVHASVTWTWVASSAAMPVRHEVASAGKLSRGAAP